MAIISEQGRAAFIAALCLCGSAGCASAPGAQGAAMCSGQGVAVYANFPVAGRHDCAIAPDGAVIVSVDHEPTVMDGINPSPWFAIRLVSDEAGTRPVVLDYTDYKHRYSPDTSTDSVTWTALPPAQIALNEDETRATLTLDLPAGQLWLAGAPLVSAREQMEWARARLAPAGFEEIEYGRSLAGRPLAGFIGGNLNSGRMIVALTRQHPPETTGQDAFRGFVEQLLAADAASAVSILDHYTVLLAPMPNPDGVDGGYWRLNRGGVDLNRDWGDFTQPESRALSQWILREAADRQVIAFMDFHSTNRDVIYAPPLNAPSPTVGFLPALEAAFKARLAAPPAWSYGHNENGGTTKGWALEALKAPGITVELWDETSETDARRIGEVIADTLADYFPS